MIVKLDTFIASVQNFKEYLQLQQYNDRVAHIIADLHAQQLSHSTLAKGLEFVLSGQTKKLDRRAELFELFFILMREAPDFQEQFIVNEGRYSGEYGIIFQQLADILQHNGSIMSPQGKDVHSIYLYLKNIYF